MAVVVTVAPVGPIAMKADNPHLPTQPGEIADAVVEAHQSGAAIAHLHFRDVRDRPTADLKIARRTIEMIADRCPILVQVSTGVGLDVPFADRAALVELEPRMATLNPCSMTFGSAVFDNPPKDVRRLAARMRDLGVKPELEIYDSGHLDECLRLRDEGFIDPETMQFSIVLGVRGGMAATADNLLAMVRRLPHDAIWQVVAVGRENLRLTALALGLGGQRPGRPRRHFVYQARRTQPGKSATGRPSGTARHRSRPRGRVRGGSRAPARPWPAYGFRGPLER